MIRLVHIQSILLLAGAGLWVMAEGLGMFSGGIVGYKAVIGSIAFVCIAAGLTVLWRDPVANALSRFGASLSVAGTGLMAAEFYMSLDSGARRGSDLTGDSLFLVAMALVVLGTALIGLWILRARPYPPNVGALLLTFVAISLAGALFAFPPAVQSISDIGVAVVLAEVAVLAMGRGG
jgi:hypothetical protein